MSSRLGEQGVLSNSHYDSKDMVHHFRPDFNEGTLPSNGHSNRGSPSSDPGTLESTASPGSYNYFPSGKSSYSNGYSGYEAGSSPTYERKENVSFHHHLPLSPVSPLHPSKFFFHSAFSKNFATFPKELTAEMHKLSSASPRLFGLPLAVSPREPLVSFGDVPVQDTPIDLSVRKPETPTSDATVDGMEEDEYINMDDTESEHAPTRAETPLDLTSKRAVSC